MSDIEERASKLSDRLIETTWSSRKSHYLYVLARLQEERDRALEEAAIAVLEEESNDKEGAEFNAQLIRALKEDSNE